MDSVSLSHLHSQGASVLPNTGVNGGDVMIKCLLLGGVIILIMRIIDDLLVEDVTCVEDCAMLVYAMS